MDENIEAPVPVQVPASKLLQFQKSAVGVGLLQVPNLKSNAPLFNNAPPLVTY